MNILAVDVIEVQVGKELDITVKRVAIIENRLRLFLKSFELRVK